jgi:hypothetical protein
MMATRFDRKEAFEVLHQVGRGTARQFARALVEAGVAAPGLTR